jgi:hypothetical protein
MKTRLAALASCIALGAAVGLHGCADNRASVQIQAICYPEDDCSFSSRCDQYFGGVAQTATGSLVLYLQVSNQLPNNESLDTGRLNTNDAHVTEISVEYEGAQANTQRGGANSYVPAGGSSIVPIGLGITAAGNILAHVRMIGHYDDGTSFETGDFPIAVYAGGDACPGNPCAGATTTCPPGGAAQCPVACSGGSAPSGSYTIGGTVSGLTTSGLILEEISAGLPNLTINASGSFTFSGSVPDGASYDVRVRQQPTGQTCSVLGGTGTVGGANVTSITVTCS